MNVFIRSALFIVLLTYLNSYLGIISPILQFLIVLFNIMIYLLSKKSNEKRLENMSVELVDTQKITH